MQADGQYEPYLKRLSKAVDEFTAALLSVSANTERQLIDELMRVVAARNADQNFNGDGLIREVEHPKIGIACNPMGEGNHYYFEIPTAFGDIGFVMITNLDATPSMVNRYLEFAPIYVNKDGRVNWFYYMATEAMEYNLAYHLAEITYRLNPKAADEGPYRKRLAWYRQVLVEQHGYSNEGFDRLVEAHATVEDALTHLKGLVNGFSGASAPTSRYDRPDPTLEAPELERVRETFDPGKAPGWLRRKRSDETE